MSLSQRFSHSHLDVPVLGDLIPLDQLGDATGIKNMIVGRHLAHEQFTHDQQEMTHLAAILPGVYKIGRAHV